MQARETEKSLVLDYEGLVSLASQRDFIARRGGFGHNRNMSEIDDQYFNSALPVILVGASPLPIAEPLAQLPVQWPLIAVDGGGDALLALGRNPELIIGDMDSLQDRATIPNNVATMHLTGQDDTDLEKALERISAPYIIGLGFMEGRFDHSLAAIHALMRIDHDRPIMLVGATDILLRVRGNFAADLPIGSRFSIWPLGQQRFRASKGLKWPLDGMHMAPGRLIGTSNEVSDTRVEIIANDAENDPGSSVADRQGDTCGDGYAVILPLAALPALLKSIEG